MSEEWNNLKYEIEHQDYLKEQYPNHTNREYRKSHEGKSFEHESSLVS